MRSIFVSLVFVGVLGAREVDQLVKDFVGDRALKTASAGLVVLPMEGGDAVAEWDGDRALIPASVMKAVTTATALQILGPDYVFETRLFLKGDDLVIVGGGDPTLGSTSLTVDFEGWVKALKNAGVSEIRGDVIGDGSRFESRRAVNDWPWGDVGNYYGAGPSGLNFHMNSFRVTFAPGVVGKSASLRSVWPKPPGVVFENFMKTGPAGSGDRGYVYGGPGAKRMSFRGSVPAGGEFSIRGALPDPALLCVESLRDYLETEGIAVLGQALVEKREVRGLKPLAVTKSPSLLKIIEGTNRRSVNLYADSIFKALTTSGTTEASSWKLREHWKKQGVDLTGFTIHDGSGLSPRGTVTARQIAEILRLARKHATGDQFYRSLPSRFGGRAKSGSMTRVRSFGGYFVAKSGKEFVFVVMVNNQVSSVSGAIDRVVLGLKNVL